MTTWIQRTAAAVVVVTGLVVAGVMTLVLVGAHDGYQAVAMQTGSMSPLVNPGDLAVVKQVAPSSIRVGDVITFQAPISGAPLVTHRVVGVAGTPAAPAFRTKGDANQSPDPWTIVYTANGWRMTRVLPHLGSVLDFLRGDGGRTVTGVVLFFLVLGLFLMPGGGRRPPHPALAEQGT